ncbi:MAG: hypothetical protein AB1401_00025 [Thermodesulfobacteriota bacterium]
MVNIRAKFLIPVAALIVLISSLYLAFFFDRSNIIVGLTVAVFITFLGVGIHTPEDVNEWEKKN